MPIPNNQGEDLMKHLQGVQEMEKGDLFVKFDIQFPRKMKEQYKQVIVGALKQNEEELE